MKIKTYICDRCGKDRPVWKNKTINGERKKFCKICTSVVEKEISKERRKKAREKKRDTVTVKKLDIAFSKLVKVIYPLYCHACSSPLEEGSKHTQACHFVERGRHIVRWDIRNVYPGCSSCNGFDPTHVYELGKKANMYWGEGTAEKMRTLKVNTYKWSQSQMKELYELFTNPPQGADIDDTRTLILKQYLRIYES